MHIVIAGAGITGVTAAWYLRAAGHRVTVVDRRAGPGLEASFANGGQISMSHPEPWSNPGAPATILRWLGRRDAPLLFRMPAELSRWRWGVEFLRECLPGRSRRNTYAIASLAAYSGQLLKRLRQDTGIQYNQLQRGVLHLYFNPRELGHGQQQLRILQQLGIGARMLTRDECLAEDPSLARLAPRLAGAMLGTDDETGDAYRFTCELATLAAQAGVEFIFEHSIEKPETADGRVTALYLRDKDGRRGALAGDAFVLAAGAYSKQLARHLGERLPIYPVKGYSASAPILDSTLAPTVSMTDESHRIVCTRLGEVLRIAGTAELNGYNLELDPARCEALVRWVNENFPGACDTSKVEYWAGLRPATPSNVPLIGRSRYPNFFYNTGHGTLGWTLACGSGKAIADIVDGKTPEPRFPFLKNGV